MKILISPGFGAGWSTWADGHITDKDSLARRALTYQPIIDAIESGDWRDKSKRSDLSHLAEKELDGMYMGGFRDLVIEEVDGPFRIEEYDGSESVCSVDDLHVLDPDQQ